MGVCSWKWFHSEEKASETWNNLAKDRQLRDAMHRREPNALNRGDSSMNKSSIELIQWMIAPSIYCSVHDSQASNGDRFYWKTTRLGPLRRQFQGQRRVAQSRIHESEELNYSHCRFTWKGVTLIKDRFGRFEQCRRKEPSGWSLDGVGQSCGIWCWDDTSELKGRIIGYGHW